MSFGAKKIYSVEIDGERFEVTISGDDNVLVSVSKGTKSFTFHVKSDGRSESMSVSHGKNQLPVLIENSGSDLFVHLGSRSSCVTVRTERDLLLEKYQTAKLNRKTQLQIESPLPGLIIKIQAKVGSKLRKGESVVIIEAMKMENEIRVPHDCTVTEINVNEGQAIDKGHIIARFE